MSEMPARVDLGVSHLGRSESAQPSDCRLRVDLLPAMDRGEAAIVGGDVVVPHSRRSSDATPRGDAARSKASQRLRRILLQFFLILSGTHQSKRQYQLTVLSVADGRLRPAVAATPGSPPRDHPPRAAGKGAARPPPLASPHERLSRGAARTRPPGASQTPTRIIGSPLAR